MREGFLISIRFECLELFLNTYFVSINMCMFVYTHVQDAYMMKKALELELKVRCLKLELKVDFESVKMGAWTKLQSSKRTTSTLP